MNTGEPSAPSSSCRSLASDASATSKMDVRANFGVAAVRALRVSRRRIRSATWKPQIAAPKRSRSGERAGRVRSIDKTLLSVACQRASLQAHVSQPGPFPETLGLVMLFTTRTRNTPHIGRISMQFAAHISPGRPKRRTPRPCRAAAAIGRSVYDWHKALLAVERRAAKYECRARCGRSRSAPSIDVRASASSSTCRHRQPRGVRRATTCTTSTSGDSSPSGLGAAASWRMHVPARPDVGGERPSRSSTLPHLVRLEGRSGRSGGSKTKAAYRLTQAGRDMTRVEYTIREPCRARPATGSRTCSGFRPWLEAKSRGGSSGSRRSSRRGTRRPTLPRWPPDRLRRR